MKIPEAAALVSLLALAGCEGGPVPPVLPGGATTIFDESPNAFSQPAPGLDRERELLFFVGNSFFNQNWVTAPASTTARDGLGPLFNARSCAGCHLKDGRGRPPLGPDDLGGGLLLRLSHPGPSGAHVPDPVYGGQLQDQAIPGVPAEGRLAIEWEEVPVAVGDSVVKLRRPSFSIRDLGYGPIAADLAISPRLAPQIVGLGLLEAVPESEVLSRADPDDRDGDGISGRPNRVPDRASGEVVLGRFGWKANVGSVREQVAGAFVGDMGITTSLFPDQDCTPAEAACRDAPDGGEPEIPDEDLEKVVLYARSLAVPALRNATDPEVVRGYRAFLETGCGACHAPTLTTGDHPTVPALSGQRIHPYTDLLLHDMGEELADGRPDGEASGSEWRTPPLWGIGLLSTVNGNRFFLHDGRARDANEAILWHGGEGAAARDRYREARPEERAALLRFLESL